MKPNLYTFQQTAVDFMLTRKRCLNACEPGLGKSLMAISGAVRVKAKNVLIICPASLVLMWQAEIKKWISGAQVIVVKTKTPVIELSGEQRFIICSYNYIQKTTNVSRLLKLKWDCIISDESHALKSFRSKTCKGFVTLTKSTDAYIWLLTGTPASKNAQDYYPYLEIIEPGKWGSFWQFSKEYCNTVKNFWTGGFDYTGCKKKMLPVLRDTFKRISIRYLKKDVLLDLPDKIVSQIPIEIDHKIVAESLALDKDLVKHRIACGKSLPAHVMSVTSSIGEAKIDAAVEYINGIDEPLVVFCTHVAVVDGIIEKLSGKRVVKFTGAQSQTEKEINVTAFQNGEADVIILNCQAGGVGITLTASSHVLFVELPWSPTLRAQARDRVHRIGQKECCNIVEMVAVGTIDEDILEALNNKEKFIKEVLGDELYG